MRVPLWRSPPGAGGGLLRGTLGAALPLYQCEKASAEATSASPSPKPRSNCCPITTATSLPTSTNSLLFAALQADAFLQKFESNRIGGKNPLAWDREPNRSCPHPHCASSPYLAGSAGSSSPRISPRLIPAGCYWAEPAPTTRHLLPCSILTTKPRAPAGKAPHVHAGTTTTASTGIAASAPHSRIIRRLPRFSPAYKRRKEQPRGSRGGTYPQQEFSLPPSNQGVVFCCRLHFLKPGLGAHTNII